MNNCMNIPLNYLDFLQCPSYSRGNKKDLVRNHMLIRTDMFSRNDNSDSDLWINSRSLKDLCKYTIVLDMESHLVWMGMELPLSLNKELLTEAILQRELTTIARLVSEWQDEVLYIKQLIPKEEFPLKRNFLTEPLVEQTLCSNILDAFINGLLTRRQHCRLKEIDFRGFEEDRRLSIELSRIPALWLTVEKRNDLKIFSHVSRAIKLKQLDYLHRYFKKISTIYANVEGEFKKDQKFDEVVIYFDCHLMTDEIAVGLSLVSMTPFNFHCSKLWISELQEIYLPCSNLLHIFDPLKITHFQLENKRLHYDSDVLNSSFQWIRSLRNLNTLAILGSFVSEESSSQIPVPLKCLNQSIIMLRYLQKLNLSRSCLKSQLRVILSAVSQPLVHLNLQDCSLQIDDLEFLIYSWRPFPFLKELNLSRNNFSEIPDRIIKALIARSVLCGNLIYFSVAYCSIPGQKLCKCLRLIGKTIMSPLITPDRIFPPVPKFKFEQKMKSKFLLHNNFSEEIINLRVLCIQNFIPLPADLLHQILYLSCQLQTLRTLQIFPDALYAFPGANDFERFQSKSELIENCHSYLFQLGRNDLTIV